MGWGGGSGSKMKHRDGEGWWGGVVEVGPK